MVTLTNRGSANPKTNGRQIPLRGDPKDIVVLGNVKVDDVRGEWESTRAAGMPGTKISATGSTTPPTVTINSAAFSGSNLNLRLALPTGANNTVVKVDVYIDGTYKKSFNGTMTNISLDALSLAAGSHNIEVRAFTKYMYCATATGTAVK
jgi:hypothetical protein